MKELDKKLNEEVAEYQADKSIEEMADILEVLFAVCEARGHSVEELLQVKEFKREKRNHWEQLIDLLRRGEHSKNEIKLVSEMRLSLYIKEMFFYVMPRGLR